MSTDNEDEIEETARKGEEGKGKQGGGKAGGAGAIGQTKANISPAFFDFMKSIGATMEQITRILREWAHLKGADLLKKLSDFNRDLSRASAHVQVQFDGKDFSLVSNLLRFFTKSELAKDHKIVAEDRIKPGLN